MTTPRMMTTLQKLCERPGVIAARCQYVGEPFPYTVMGCSLEINGSDYADRLQVIMESALKLAALCRAKQCRALFPESGSILVVQHPHIPECYLAVYYNPSSPVVKSLLRMVRGQFKHFERHSIQMEPGVVELPSSRVL